MDNLSAPVILAVSLIFISFALFTLNQIWNPHRYKGFSAYPPPAARRFPILGHIHYFAKRWDFIREATQSGGPASFHLAGQHVVAMGRDHREAFWNDGKTSFALGYAVMLGATPSMNKDFLKSVGFDITLGGRSNKRLLTMLQRERISNILPTLYTFAGESIDKLGESGITNPFESIYAAIFQITMRTIGSSRVAEDRVLCDEAREIFEGLDQSGTPITLMFPWFFGKSLPASSRWDRMKRFFLMRKFYLIVRDSVADRIREGRRDDDPLQVLIDNEHTTIEMAQFTIAALFAGIANTGIIAGYLLSYLATNPEWMTKIREEVRALANRHSPDSSVPLFQRLQSVKYEEWESELPILNACLRDAIRLHIVTPMMRLNHTGKDVTVGGVLIPKDAVMTYHSAEVHHNPAIYTNPLKWDPSRFDPDRAEDKKQPMAFCGWGLGRHPCLGARFAKFEISMLTALFVMNFDFELVDAQGESVKMPPVRQQDQVVSPPEPSLHLKYQRHAYY